MLVTKSAKRYVRDKFYLQKRRAKKIILAAPFWVLVIGLALTTFGIGRYFFLVHNRQDQNMSEYWGYEATVPYRHMSVYARGARPGGQTTPPIYIDSASSLRRSDILTIRTTLQNLADVSSGVGGKSGLGQDGRPRGWEDCYSSFMMASISSVASPDSVTEFSFNSPCEIIAIDGNFTAFHPFRFMSGGFLPEIPYDYRQIVLNDVLAWKFYKSYDVLGETVKLWGENFTIIGVVSEPTDRISRSAGAEQPRAYIYFNAMEELAPLEAQDIRTQQNNNSNQNGGNNGGSNGSSAAATPTPAAAANAQAAVPGAPAGNNTPARPDMAILCYEAMLPEAVRGVARNDMSSSLTNYTPADPNYYVVSNTGRFGLRDSWRFMWPIGKTQSRLSAYEFPFWEKTAQLTSQHLFADEIVTVAGFITLVSGGIMAALRHRKMTRK